MDAKQKLDQLHTLAITEFSPEQHVIHKPNRNGTGQALKLQLRMEPEWVETDDGGYFNREANKDGGLFIEIVPQGPKQGEFATFLWKDADKIARAKLGVPDISGLLVAIREYRVSRANVPDYLQDRKTPQPNVVSLFHKNQVGSTIISYTFEEQQSILRISKGKGKAGSIGLTLGEELVFQKLLDMALEAYLRVGKR